MPEVEKQLNQLFTLHGIKAQIVKTIVGPTFTRYEASVDAFSFRMDKFTALEDNIAHLVQAPEPPILYPIYERSVVAIDVLNQQRAEVRLDSLLSQIQQSPSQMKIPIVLGADVHSQPYLVDLVETPHILVAGTTGSGKSVSLRSMLTSLIHFNRNVELLLIDPKAVELSVFNDLGLGGAVNVVTDIEEAQYAFDYVHHQVNVRYDMLCRAGVSNISDTKGIPYLVLVIDELADLLQYKKTFHNELLKIAQKSRAAGIHIIAATQRPSVDVISGVIKNNFPTRIAFKVGSQEDSRTIFGCGGAERLLGRGDMLYRRSTNSFERLQGAMVTNQEIIGLLKR